MKTKLMINEMKTPPLLQKGDAVGLISTARKISQQEVQPALELFSKWGLNVVKGKHLHASYNQFAGTDQERKQDLQKMLDDPDIKAIICARGGYGTARIIDQLDFSGFAKRPKWIAGYSDVTVLHSHVHTNFAIETLHATMPLNFPENGLENQSVLSLKKALFEGHLHYEISDFQIVNGENFKDVSGILTGGNLSMLYSLIQSPSDINTHNKILFMEDLDEYLYHVDRMVLNLKRSGKLAFIKALLVGWMSDMNDNAISFGRDAKQIICDHMKDTGIPIIFGFPAGHLEPNLTLILGRKIRIQQENVLTLWM